MATPMQMKQARQAIAAVAHGYLADWKYRVIDDGLTIETGVRGNGKLGDVMIQIKARPESAALSFYFDLPFKVPDGKRVDMAIAICVANYGIINGAFDYDIDSGIVWFRMCQSYCDSYPSREKAEYMMRTGYDTMENYAQSFQKICRGTMSIERFLEQER